MLRDGHLVTLIKTNKSLAKIHSFIHSSCMFIGIAFLRGFEVSLQVLGGTQITCQLFLFRRNLSLTASHAQLVGSLSLSLSLSLSRVLGFSSVHPQTNTLFVSLRRVDVNSLLCLILSFLPIMLCSNSSLEHACSVAVFTLEQESGIIQADRWLFVFLCRR